MRRVLVSGPRVLDDQARLLKGSAGCSVNDREPPWVTLLTGTRGTRLGKVSKISGKLGSGTQKLGRIILEIYC